MQDKQVEIYTPLHVLENKVGLTFAHQITDGVSPDMSPSRVRCCPQRIMSCASLYEDYRKASMLDPECISAFKYAEDTRA
jgi:hypothetical protein